MLELYFAKYNIATRFNKDTRSVEFGILRDGLQGLDFHFNKSYEKARHRFDYNIYLQNIDDIKNIQRYLIKNLKFLEPSTIVLLENIYRNSIPKLLGISQYRYNLSLTISKSVYKMLKKSNDFSSYKKSLIRIIENQYTIRKNKPYNINFEFESFKTSFIKRLNDNNYSFSESDITIKQGYINSEIEIYLKDSTARSTTQFAGTTKSPIMDKNLYKTCETIIKSTLPKKYRLILTENSLYKENDFAVFKFIIEPDVSKAINTSEVDNYED